MLIGTAVPEQDVGITESLVVNVAAGFLACQVVACSDLLCTFFSSLSCFSIAAKRFEWLAAQLRKHLTSVHRHVQDMQHTTLIFVY